MQMMPKATKILELAQVIAKERGPTFFERLGPGKDKGNGSTKSFMEELGLRVRNEIGADLAEACICGANKLSVDFFVAHEGTIIEIELGARNPHTNFERDIFKALLARDTGFRVDRLIIVGKPGTLKRLRTPDAKAIANWVTKHQGLEIDVFDL